MPEFVTYLEAERLRYSNHDPAGAILSMDSLVLDTGNVQKVRINFAPMEIKRSEVLSITFNATDQMHRLKSIGQWVLTREPRNKLAYLLMNGGMEGSSIELTGLLEQTGQFHQRITRTKNDRQWITLAAFDLAHGRNWITNVNCYMEVSRNEQGRITRITTTKTLGSSGFIRLLGDKNLYSVDMLKVVSVKEFPQGISRESESYISQVILTGQ